MRRPPLNISKMLVIIIGPALTSTAINKLPAKLNWRHVINKPNAQRGLSLAIHASSNKSPLDDVQNTNRHDKTEHVNVLPLIGLVFVVDTVAMRR